MSQITINLDDFCPAGYATFLILKIGSLEVDLWHFSCGKVAIKFTFPPQFLLVLEKRKISKIRALDLLCIHVVMQALHHRFQFQS